MVLDVRVGKGVMPRATTFSFDNINGQLIYVNNPMNDCCAVCESEDSLKQCSKCKHAVYCSRKCQSEDWNSLHGYVCVALAAAPFTAQEFNTYADELSQLREELCGDDNGYIGARRRSGISRAKACKILHHGRVSGHKLTNRQRRYMGWVCGGRKRRHRRK